ncbi:peptidase S8/S53 domain-containing protein [Annulohypoxylon truncatum]|uniref:peptidase S8/S53 domain-containing protein n=1 Tax=Annulohypoxylon truncatum TaxID=327061 RepID=UPI0020078F42|nr:peptidase S8/S53 domain-containing protein [Annulohypoxylon truncatum]KAI1204616.1 peptidase S8/S53 domain-containing protein [Annulohypoxylon truncatum]
MTPRKSFLDVEVTYVIYPKDGTNKTQTDLIEKKLKDFADPSTIYVSQTRTVGINFWLATLPHKKADIIAVELAHEVASIYPHAPEDTSNLCHDAFDWTTTFRQILDGSSHGAADHLKFVCQQPGTSLDDLHGYWYDDADPIPGNGIPVYIVDTGATLDHREFDDIRGDIEWLHVGEDVGGGSARDDSGTDPTQQFTTAKAHGTSMLSLVTGRDVGVSKRVKPYLVRMPRRHIPTGTAGDRSGHPTNEDWLEAISKVNDHLITRSNEAKAIALLAFHIPRESFMRDGEDHSAGFDARMRYLLKDLICKGVLPITGSGNYLEKTTVDGFPANYGRSDYDPIPEVLVVRGVHVPSFELDSQTDFDRGLPHVFAPGSNIKCAEGNRAVWHQIEDKWDGVYRAAKGTSCAAAITAGLAAYFLRLVQVRHLNIDKSPLGLKNYIISDDLMWSRKPSKDGKPMPAIWNGVRFP